MENTTKQRRCAIKNKENPLSLPNLYIHKSIKTNFAQKPLSPLKMDKLA
mgnify:CR=1 FL=1